MNAQSDSIDVAIIGSGFAGLCMAIKLKEAGFTDFFIAEQAQTLGGTWRDNHYPGCACDVQSHVYSFSFAPNPSGHASSRRKRRSAHTWSTAPRASGWRRTCGSAWASRGPCSMSRSNAGS